MVNNISVDKNGGLVDSFELKKIWRGLFASIVSVSDLLEKDFSNMERLMEKNDVLESRVTTGKHDDRTGLL